VHKVQILDPATGTGTFLAKAVQLIADRVKARAPGKWSATSRRPAAAPARLRAADGELRHVPHEARHDADRTGYKPSALRSRRACRYG
jgi:hypothetical protein